MLCKVRELVVRLLTILVVIAAVFALSVVPAAAEFQSSQKQGTMHILAFGEFKVGTVGVTTCVAKEVEGQWHIQVKGQIKQQLQEDTAGPQLLVQVKSWGKCETKISGGKGLVTEIKPCNMRMVQRSSGEGSVGLSTSCLLRIGTETKEPLCEIQMPAGMETKAESDRGINVGLLESKYTKSPNLKAKLNVAKAGTGGPEGEGIYAQSVGSNAACALPKVTEKTELIGVEFEGENLAARPQVLTRERVNGPRVPVGEKLTGKLESGTEAKFKSLEPGGGEIKCSKSEIEGKVTANPETEPSVTKKAFVELEGIKYADLNTCSSTFPGTTGVVNAIDTNTNLLAEMENILQRIFIRKGIGEEVQVTFKVAKTGGGELACTYSGTEVWGGYDNTGSAFSIFMEISRLAGPECPAKVDWAAKYKPVKDAGGKEVFVND